MEIAAQVDGAMDVGGGGRPTMVRSQSVPVMVEGGPWTKHVRRFREMRRSFWAELEWLRYSIA
jgi:hypothetical protein